MRAFNEGNPLRRMMMGREGSRGGRPLGTREGQGFRKKPTQAINPELAPMTKNPAITGAGKPGVPGVRPSGPSGSIGGMVGTQGAYTPPGQATNMMGNVNRMGGIGLPPVQQTMQPGMQLGGGRIPPPGMGQQQPGQPQVPEWYRNRGKFGGGNRFGGGY